MRCVINGMVYGYRPIIECPFSGKRCTLSPDRSVGIFDCMFGERNDGDDVIYVDCKLRELVEYAIVKLDDGGVL